MSMAVWVKGSPKWSSTPIVTTVGPHEPTSPARHAAQGRMRKPSAASPAPSSASGCDRRTSYALSTLPRSGTPGELPWPDFSWLSPCPASTMPVGSGPDCGVCSTICPSGDHGHRTHRRVWTTERHTTRRHVGQRIASPRQRPQYRHGQQRQPQELTLSWTRSAYVPKIRLNVRDASAVSGRLSASSRAKVAIPHATSYV